MKKVFSIFIVFVFLLGGCVYPQQEEEIVEIIVTPEPTEAVILPDKGGEIRLSVRAPKTLNPLLNEDQTVDNLLKLVFEPLAVLNDKQKPVSNLAEFSFSSDGMSAVVTLKNAKWSDSAPITSEDIAFSIQTLKNAPSEAIYANAVSNVDNCEPIDSRSARINFKRHYAAQAYSLCFPIIPQHYYEGETGENFDKNLKPLGNGLYVVEKYEIMKSVKLTANDLSFREKPYISEITALVIPDKETELHAFEQSIIDAVAAPLANWGKYHGLRDIHVTEYDTTNFDFIGFNFNNSLFRDKNIRVAVAHCLNVEEIIDGVYLNHASRASAPINAESWLYEPDVAQYEFDLEEAGKLIGESEFSKISFSILVNSENDERSNIAEILSKNLESLNVKTEIISVGFDEFQEKLEVRDFDLFLGGYNLSTAPDLTFAFHSSKIGVGGNYMGYSDYLMDGLLEQAAGAVGDGNFLRAQSAVQKWVAEELPVISLVFRKSALLTDTNIRGEITPVLNNIFFNMNDWFINSL